MDSILSESKVKSMRVHLVALYECVSEGPSWRNERQKSYHIIVDLAKWGGNVNIGFDEGALSLIMLKNKQRLTYCVIITHL